MSSEKLIDKVRKLLAKAERTDNQAEADSFMAKANEMLLKHNLTLSQVKTSNDDNGITEEGYAVKFGDVMEEGKWETTLMATLCAHNMCDSIIHSMKYQKGGSMSVIGSEDNVATVLYMFDVSRNLIRRLSKSAYSDYRKHIVEEWRGLSDLDLQKQGILGYRMPWIRSYLKGTVIGLHSKLEQQKNEFLGADSNLCNQYGLMVVSNREAIERFKKERYSDLEECRKGLKVSNDHGAFERGVEEGKNVNIVKGLGGFQQPESRRLS